MKDEFKKARIIFLIFFVNVLQKNELQNISFLKDMQPFKSSYQYLDYIEKVYPEFTKDIRGDDFCFKYLNYYDTYQLRLYDKLVSTVFLDSGIFTGKFQKKIIKRKTIHIYTLLTLPEFRGCGFAKILLKSSIDEILKRKICITIFSRILSFIKRCLPFKKDLISGTNCLYILHINPTDKMMWFNFAFYYSIGFKHAKISLEEPRGYCNRLDEVNDFQDSVIEAKNVDKYTENIYFLIMICPMENFNLSGKIDPENLKTGTDLQRKLLKKRQQHLKCNKD